MAPAGGDEESNIQIVMEQTECTREQAVEALKVNNGNAINAIMDLMQ